MTAPFRYKKLGYVALNVTDVARTHDFVMNVYGLDEAGTGAGGERLLPRLRRSSFCGASSGQDARASSVPAGSSTALQKLRKAFEAFQPPGVEAAVGRRRGARAAEG